MKSGLPTLAIVLSGWLGVSAHASVTIPYAVTGASGDSWTGTFVVTNLSAPVVSYSGPESNPVSFSRDGADPLPFGEFGYFGSNRSGFMSWESYDEEWNGFGYFEASSYQLYTTINPSGGWNGTWNDLVGMTFDLTTYNSETETWSVGQAVFNHYASSTLLEATGGTISFGQAQAVPEPSGSLAVGVGCIALALCHRRRSVAGSAGRQ